MKTNILVTGGNGQLGRCIKDLEDDFSDFNISYKNALELDIVNKDQVFQLFKQNKYDWCINCAAYTNVEKAEINVSQALNVNQLGAKNIAIACNVKKTKLIHISTDFVFDGDSTRAYTESDTTNPINIYGLSKLKGEKEIQNALNEYFIIRTSWLYSEYGSNFLKTMLRLADKKNKISVVSNQIGNPTYAKDLANVLLSIAKADVDNYGIYNYSNNGETSWHDFASEIFKMSKLQTQASPILSSNYPTQAKRPKYSALDKTKIKDTFNISIPHWRDSLELAINSINE